MVKKILSILAFSTIAFSLAAQAQNLGDCYNSKGVFVKRFVCVSSLGNWTLWASQPPDSSNLAYSCPKDTGYVYGYPAGDNVTILQDCQNSASDPKATVKYNF